MTKSAQEEHRSTLRLREERNYTIRTPLKVWVNLEVEVVEELYHKDTSDPSEAQINLRQLAGLFCSEGTEGCCYRQTITS